MKKRFDIGFICQFALDDFKTKYAGSFLGFVWAFLQPTITVVIYWFVFQIGFQTESVNGVPFIIWLISGLLPWFFVSDAITNATSSLIDYSYLVKKVVFNIDILPLARIVSVFFIQVFLLAVSVILCFIYGVKPTIYWVQILYYMIYMFIICVGISYFTSALYVFFKDTVQVVAVILQVVFWGTPIVWRMDIMTERIQAVLRYNPLYYITNGYRDAVVNRKWFVEYSVGDTMYYWIIAFAIMAIGMYTFKKLKQHFADVL